MTDTKKLKARMVENGILLDTLAKKVGISRASLSYKINNKRQFSAEEIRDISSELQLKSEEIQQIFLN
jgi:DNA-binding helix-turn-helix protein